MTIVTTRVPQDIVREIDKVSRDQHTDRSTLLRKLISKGLQEEQKEQALEKYRAKKISLQKMASLLKISYLDALEIIKQAGVHLDYGLEELQEDLQGLS